MAKIIGVQSDGALFMVSVGKGDALSQHDVELVLVLDFWLRRFVTDEVLPANALAGRGYWEDPSTVSPWMVREASALADEQLQLRDAAAPA